MEVFFTLDNLVTFALLVLLQVVLGVDNLFYMYHASKRVSLSEQERFRRYAFMIAIFLRFVLLFVVVKLIATFQGVLFSLDWLNVISVQFTLQSLIFLMAGVMIMYTTTKAITHILTIEEKHSRKNEKNELFPFLRAVFLMLLINLVFSFEVVVSGMALTDSLFMMLPAIVIGTSLMVLLAGHIDAFLNKNRKYAVLGLFILFLVGGMLIAEGGHLANLHLFGKAIEPMSKVTFYLIVVLMMVIAHVQERYKKKRMAVINN